MVYGTSYSSCWGLQTKLELGGPSIVRWRQMACSHELGLTGAGTDQIELGEQDDTFAIV